MSTDKETMHGFTGKVKTFASELTGLSMEQFSSRIANLEKNLEALDSQTIRSGLIGITSSGKSSLLNTILGTGSKILKEQSKATTNMIVFCSKSKEPELQIFFDGADTLVKKGNEVLGESIWKYTSEDENPLNKFSVQFIKLSLPTFMLGDGFELADTPGLDAFGHKEHEDLTLREFLPQANLIIYLSSIRSPMKEADRKILDKVMDADQRIVFVQTCKGAVVEQKFEGQETKSVQEQLDEYKGKLKEAISHYDNLKDSPIVQVETSQAMEYFKDTDNLAAWRQSGLDEFIYVVEEAIKQIREEFTLLNLRRIVDEVLCVNELISNLLKEDDDKSVVLEQQNDYLAELQDYHEQIGQDIEKLVLEWDEQMDSAAIYNKYKEEFSEIYTTRYNFNPMHDEKFLAKAQTIDEETKILKGEFLDVIDVAKKRYTRYFKELGLDVRRMDYQKIDKHNFFLPNVQKKNLSEKLGDQKGGEIDRTLQYVDKNRYIQDLEGSLQQFFEPLLQHLIWWRQASTFSFLEPLLKKTEAIKADMANIEKGITLSDAQKAAMSAMSSLVEQAVKEVLPLFDRGAVGRKIKAYSRFIGRVEEAKVENANIFLQLGNRLFENLFHTLYLDTLQGFTSKKQYKVVLIGQSTETQLDFLRRLLRLDSQAAALLSATETPFAINAEKSLAHLTNIPVKGDLQDRITFYLLGNDEKSLAVAKKSKLFENADVVQVIIDDLHRVGSALRDMVERLLFYELIQKHNKKLLFSYPAAAYFRDDKLHLLVTEAIAEVNKVFQLEASQWFVHESFEARYGCFSRLGQKISQKEIKVDDAVKEWKSLGLPLDEPFSEEILKEQFAMVSAYK